MSEQTWVLKGVDAQSREQAVEEAARRGMSLSDYLTDVVLRTALAEQVATLAPPIEEIAPAETSAPEAFALRQRLKALERRINTAVSSVDGAMQTMDAALIDISDRVGEVESLAGDTAHGLIQAQQETTAGFAGARLHISDVEDNSVARDDAAEAALNDATAVINQRIDGVEAIATHASSSAAALTDAYETLKYAVADDFGAFARESAARLGAGLAEVREAADAAAEHADAAVAHLIEELRTMREAIDQRLADNAADTRGRLHAAFADAAERMSALAERVQENESFAVRTADQLRLQLANVEDGLQSAIEETADGLRHADAALAGDLARAQRDALGAIAGARADLGADISDLREEQLAAATRHKLLDVALGTTVGEVGTLRDTFMRQVAQIALDSASQRDALERQITAEAARTSADWDDRFDALTARLSVGERDSAEARSALLAEANRIETCTFAALEKLARDLAAGDAALESSIAEVVDATLQARQHTDTAIGQVREHIDSAVSDVLDQQLSSVTRLQRLESGLVDLEGQHAPLNERINKLESVAHGLDREFAARVSRLERNADNTVGGMDIAALQHRIDGIAADSKAAREGGGLPLVEALRARIDATEAQSGEIAERLHGVARVVSRITTQQTEAGVQNEDRLHKIELAVADLRLAQIGPAADAHDHTDAIAEIAARFEDMERRQATALTELQADIVRFVSDNDQRLAALEQGQAPTGLEEQFLDLRRRIEERIIGVEQRGVRTLEHVADTIAMLEQRFSGSEEARQSA